MAQRDYNPFKSVPRTRFRSVQSSAFDQRASQAINDFNANEFEVVAENQIAELERERGLLRGMQPKQQDKGFLGNVPGVGTLVQGGGTFLGGVFDLLSRPGTMISGAALGAQQDGLGGLARGALTGAFGTSEERSKMNFATFLEEAGGPFADHVWLRNTIGLGMDMVLDPLNLLAVGAVSSKLKKVGKAFANKEIRGQSIANSYITLKESPVSTSVIDFVSPAIGTVAESRLMRQVADRYRGANKDMTKKGLAAFIAGVKGAKRSVEEIQIEAGREIGERALVKIEDYQQLHGHRPVITEDVERRAHARLEHFRTKPWTDRKAVAPEELAGTWAESFPEGLPAVPQASKGGASSAEELESIGESLLLDVIEDLFDKEKGDVGLLFSDDVRGRLTPGQYIRGAAGGKEDWLRIRKGLRHSLGKDAPGGRKGFLKSRKEGAVDHRQVQSVFALGAYDLFEKRLYALQDFILTALLEPATTKKQAAEFTRRQAALQAAGLGREYFAQDALALAAVSGSAKNTGLVFNTTVAKTGADKGKRVFTKAKRNGPFKGQVVDEAINSPSWKETYGDIEFGTYAPGLDEFVLKADTPGIDGADELLKAATKRYRVGKKEYLMPTDMKEALQTVSSPTQMSGIFHLGDFWNSMWKPYVTTMTIGGIPLFPAFYTRNAIGLMWNNMLAGVWNPLDYIDAGKNILQNTDEIIIPMQNQAQDQLQRQISTISAKYGSEFARIDESGGLVIRRGVNKRGQEVSANEIFREMLADGGLFSKPSWEAGGATRGGGAAPAMGLGARWKDLTLRLRGKTAEADELRRAEIHGISMDRWRDQIDSLGLDLAQREQSALDKALAIGPTVMGRKERVLSPVRWGRTLNELMDNVAKVAHVRAKLASGATFEEAIASANKFIGDYSAISPSIQKMSAVIPFYRWTRFNLPLQMEMLIKKPQIASKVAILEDTVGGAGSENNQVLEGIYSEGASLPDYLMERLGVIWGTNTDGTVRIIRGFGLPIEDLNKVFSLDLKNTIENLASEVTPILRAPLELATGHSFFTGKPIEDKSFSNFYRRAHNWQDKAPGLREFFGVRKHESADGTVRYSSTEPMRMYLLGSVFGRVALTAHDGVQLVSEEQDRVSTGLSFLTGVKVRDTHLRYDQKEPLQDQLNKDPDLQAIYDAYKAIPVYPDFENVEDSNKAVRAMSDIQSIARLMAPQFPDATKEGLFDFAARVYEDKGNAEGAFLARQVKSEGYKRTGAKARSEFVEAYPILRAALEGVSPQAYEWYTGRFDDEF